MMKLPMKSTEYSASNDRGTGVDALGAGSRDANARSASARGPNALGAFVALLLLFAAEGCSNSPASTPAAGGDPSAAGATLTVQAPEARRTSTSTPSRNRFTPQPFATAPLALATVSDADLPTAIPPTATSQPANDPTDRPLFAAVDGAVVEGGEIGAIFNLADIRVGRHDGYTRIVWEMEEAEGRPYHRVVTRVREDGSPVQPFGRNWLEVSISDVYAWTRPELLESRTVELDGAVTVLQQLMIGDDAIYSVGVGLAGPVRFELSLLEEPVRLVLDVFDDGS